MAHPFAIACMQAGRDPLVAATLVNDTCDDPKYAAVVNLEGAAATAKQHMGIKRRASPPFASYLRMRE